MPQASGAQVHSALQRTPDIGPRGSGLVVVAPVEEGEALLRAAGPKGGGKGRDGRNEGLDGDGHLHDECDMK